MIWKKWIIEILLYLEEKNEYEGESYVYVIQGCLFDKGNRNDRKGILKWNESQLLLGEMLLN